MNREYVQARMKYQPRFSKRPRRLLDRLAYDLVFSDEPSPVLDRRIYNALKRYLPELKMAEYTKNLDDALRIIPPRWWWHLSHMEAVVIPTTGVTGAEKLLSNAHRYDEEGRPIGYKTMIIWDRGYAAPALCAAVLTAFAALKNANGKTS